jgi:hypothetical protein
MAIQPEIEPVHEHFLVGDLMQRLGDDVLTVSDVLQLHRFSLITHPTSPIAPREAGRSILATICLSNVRSEMRVSTQMTNSMLVLLVI